MFAAFMKRWTLVIAIICAVCAIKNIVERDWLMAMWILMAYSTILNSLTSEMKVG